MAKVGDRIRLSSMKGPDREGVVTAVTGSLLRVRWPTDQETTVAPAPGTLTVLPSTDPVPQKAAKKKAAATKTTAAKKSTGGKPKAPKRSSR